MAATYLIDGEDFFLGCGDAPIEYSNCTDLRRGNWGGYTGLADEALKEAWANAPERRQKQADLMRQLWANGSITAHPTTDELRATRSRANRENWDKRRAGALAMPQQPSRNRPCTIDGVTVFPSGNALIAALGKGKKGRNHPHFRFLQL